MKKYLVLIFAFVITSNLFGQKEDHVWLFGWSPYDIILPDFAADTTRGATNFDFNYDPVRIYYDVKRLWDMDGTNTSISDGSGKLQAYSNGQVIINADNKPIADTINYGNQTSWFCNEWEINNYGDANMAIPGGLLAWQRAIILPVGEQYYTIYNSRDYCTNSYFRLAYSGFIINNDYPDGKLLQKDVEVNIGLVNDTLGNTIYAVKHGNGRDWWLITFNRAQTIILTYLVDISGIHLVSQQPTFTERKSRAGIGQLSVSPNGKMLSWYYAYTLGQDASGFCVADFDRCDGTIRNIKSKILTTPELAGGVSFSSDSRYLYACNAVSILQYDMSATDIIESETEVAQYDGYKYYFPYDTIDPIGYHVNFFLMKLGPDGKIYVFPNSANNRMISVINNPVEKGKSCDIRQHSIILNTGFTRTVPNIPEFRLGPLDGSPCDTLGIDNHPIAKYRYEPDTIDHLRIRFTDLSYFRPETWSWDFGDGSPRLSMRHPYHSYAASGTYNVCLTVSNENSSHTSCRTITIGTSSIDDGTSAAIADITLFPNPVEDYLLVTLGEYIPQHGQMMIYDISGRPVHTQRIYYGQNNVDMTRLATGMYVWKMMDGKTVIQKGKVLKI